MNLRKIQVRRKSRICWEDLIFARNQNQRSASAAPTTCVSQTSIESHKFEDRILRAKHRHLHGYGATLMTASARSGEEGARAGNMFLYSLVGRVWSKGVPRILIRNVGGRKEVGVQVGAGSLFITSLACLTERKAFCRNYCSVYLQSHALFLFLFQFGWCKK